MSEPTGGIATLGIDFKIFLAQLVNFIIVLLVLWKWAFTPIVKLLDVRTKKIEDSMKQAELVDQRVADLEKEQHQLIARAKQEASTVLETARAEAEQRKQEMLLSAKQEVERVVAQGKEQLKIEKAQMIQEAKIELVEIAVSATKKILEETIDEKKSADLAERLIKKMHSYETD